MQRTSGRQARSCLSNWSSRTRIKTSPGMRPQGRSTKRNTFAINFLRVMAGAGRPWEIWRDMVNCVKAAQAYDKAHGHSPISYKSPTLSTPTRPIEKGWTVGLRTTNSAGARMARKTQLSRRWASAKPAYGSLLLRWRVKEPSSATPNICSTGT